MLPSAEKLLPPVLGLLTAAVLVALLVRSRMRRSELVSDLGNERARTEELSRKLKELREEMEGLRSHLDLARATGASARADSERLRKSRARTARREASETMLAAELAASGLDHTRMLFSGRAELDRARGALIGEKQALREARERAEALRRAVERISRENADLEKRLRDSRQVARLRRELQKLAERIERVVSEAE